MQCLAACVLRSALAVLFAVSFPVPFAQAQDRGLSGEERLVITKDLARKKIRLLMESFRPEPGTPLGDAARVEEVVARDLAYSGIFSVFTIPGAADPDSLPAAAGHRALVRGTVGVTDGALVLRGSLESLPDGDGILSREYRTTPEGYREAAHRFADDIVLYLTGETGISRTRITFVMSRDGSREVYIVDYDGEGLRQVTRNGAINLSPTLSPDGKRVAYVSYRGGDPDIWITELASGESRVLVSGPGVQSGPAWSPSGRKIAYSQTASGASSIYVVDVGGGSSRRLTRENALDTSPCWSPDGKRLIFTSDRSGTPQLYSINADGGDTRRLTFGGKWNDLADWSPDGATVAFASRRGGAFRIYRVDPSGMGGETRSTFGPGNDENPNWAPDGRHLVFSSSRGGLRGLYVLNVENGVVRPLLAGRGDCFNPDWSGVPPR